MDTTTALHVRDGDSPRVVAISVEDIDVAHIQLAGISGPRLVCTDPAYLEALARVCDEAAVRLSAALDARAARAMNTEAGAA